MTALTITQASCADDYDPNSMPVAKARAFIHQFLDAGDRRRCACPMRSALGRVLAEDVVSPVDVPSHRNSAMDGWAMRGADLAADGEIDARGDRRLVRRASPSRERSAPGQCVRIMTGGVVPEGADTVVMQERAKAERQGDHVRARARRPGQNVREAGEDLEGRIGRAAARAHRAPRGAGPHRLARHRRGRASTGRCASRSSPPATSSSPSARRSAKARSTTRNRYTLHGMLTRLGCEVLDMGVVRDDPALLEQAFAEAAASADVVITSGGVSVGEADFVKAMLGKLGEVVFWKIAMKPGRPLAYGKIGGAHFFGLPGNPGVGDGDLLPVRARRAARADGRRSRRAGADLHGAVHRRASRRRRAAPSSSAASSRAAPDGTLDRAAHRRAGLRASSSR